MDETTTHEDGLPEAAVPAANRRWGMAWAMLALAAMAVGVFAPELLGGGRIVIGEIGHDVWMYFFWMREWGFGQIAQGNFPLWIPHINCGTPFFGTFLSALLYPPNYLFLVLPTAVAMNWTFVLHVFLAGAFTYGWCRVRGVSRMGAWLGGAIFMLCSAHFFKVGNGWPNLSHAIAWCPAVLACVEMLFKTGRCRWAMAGGLAVSMQVLCGGPQYAWSTAVVVGLYVILNLTQDRKEWKAVLGGTALMYVLAGGLCAVQIAAGADLAAESVRGGGMREEAAAVGSFHPSAYLTLLSPYVYGRRDTPVAEGAVRWLVLNIGVAGLVLAGYGAVRGERRMRRFSAVLVIIICVLAMGKYTPLHEVFQDYLPGFKYFRAMSRFMALASLLLAMLAAIGFDRLREPASRPRWFLLIPGTIGVAAIALGLSIHLTRDAAGGGAWGMMLKIVEPAGQMYARAMIGSEKETPVQRAVFTAMMLLGSGGLFVAVSLLLAGTSRFRWAVYGVLGLAAIELLITARASVCSMPVPLPGIEPWRRAVESLPDSQRTWQTIWTYPNFSIGQDKLEANGYEPAMLRRYESFLSHVAGGVPLHEHEGGSAMMNHPRLAEMLRIRRFLVWGKPWVKAAERTPMPRVSLVHEFTVAADERERFELLKSPDFEPRQRAILETSPSISPAPPSGKGTVRIVRDRIDELEIVADTPEPAILLMTDAYSHGWEALARRESAQREYEVMPANQVLRAIPLSAGKHHIVLRYRPKHFRLGMWISIATAGGISVVLGGLAIQRWRGRAGRA